MAIDVSGFERILAELDGVTAGCDGRIREELEDLNSEFEDLLLMMAELKPERADDRDELSGILEDLAALAQTYGSLTDCPERVAVLAGELAEAAGAVPEKRGG
ncbi:MAG: hypothetical protein IJH38_03835 [Clostridia bacterium]|nr:hypothetical protein [Clostridia bacterium]